MAQSFILSVALLVCATGTFAQTRARDLDAKKNVVESYVVVLRGDTVAKIALRNKVAAADLASLNRLRVNAKLRRGQRLLLPAASAGSEASASNETDGGEVVGKRITFADGTTMLADEAWRQGTVVWYTRGGVTQSLNSEVTKIDSVYAARKPTESTAVNQPPPVKPTPEKSLWIYLVGGARFKVDDVNETADGAWYHRGTVSVFVDRERIARIEREESGSAPAGFRGRDWTSGNSHIDQLIKANADRMRLDPYLVFLVIEQESHFRVRAVSPKGAQGLMQLMPGTARRFGVKRPFDAAENIRGGTKYLRELMDMFGGKVNLVLASYNAGEGAVMKYGGNVPPYRETREYVKKIGKRYGLSGRQPQDDNNVPVPRR
jgi:murein DD-endopeptidase MepM/ murein hydrolase activator NlpD